MSSKVSIPPLEKMGMVVMRDFRMRPGDFFVGDLRFFGGFADNVRICESDDFSV